MSRIALILYSVIWKNLINLHGSHSQKVEIWAWGGLKFLVCISLKVKYLKLQKLISLLISSVDTNPNFSSHWSPFSSSLVLLQYLWSLSWSSSSKLPFSMPKSYLHRAAGWFVKNLNLFTSLTYENYSHHSPMRTSTHSSLSTGRNSVSSVDFWDRLCSAQAFSIPLYYCLYSELYLRHVNHCNFPTVTFSFSSYVSSHTGPPTILHLYLLTDSWGWLLFTWHKEPTHLEKTLMLGNIDGRRRRRRQWIRWLNSVTDSMDMSLSKL